MGVNYRPEGYHTVTPYLTVRDVQALLDFAVQAFDAELKELMRRADGSIGHAEVTIGDSVVMMGQAAKGSVPMPAMLYVYVPDADATYAAAVKAGGIALREPQTQFYGDRHGAVIDPVGNQWWMATHVEDVPPDELQRRASAAVAAS
jgi:PhnB protein